MRNLSIIMVRELLMLGWELSDQGSSCWSDINSLDISFFWNNKELLFQTKSHNGSIVLNSKFFQKSLDTFTQNSLTCSEQSFIVQGMSVMRDQKSWNVKSFVSVSEENIRLDVPNSVSSGIASFSESSWRETWTITLSFQKVRSIEITISLRIHCAFAEEIV